MNMCHTDISTQSNIILDMILENMIYAKLYLIKSNSGGIVFNKKTFNSMQGKVISYTNSIRHHKTTQYQTVAEVAKIRSLNQGKASWDA